MARRSPAWSSLTTNSTPCNDRCRRLTSSSRQLERLSRCASSTASTLRRPSHLMPIATSTAWLRTAPSSRVRLFQPPLGELLQLLVQRFHDPAHTPGTELVPAQL